jgi:hypothetical protein
MEGGYLEMQMSGPIVGPIVAFREYIFSDVLAAFGNLSERADKIANDYYNHIGAQPAGEDDDIDMADVADDANEKSLDWYQMMTSLRQTMLNLLASGLFHLAEQQLAKLCRDGGFRAPPPKDTKFGVVEEWYAANLRLDWKTLPSFKTMDELRHVANAVKHGEGSSTRRLRTLRPELFNDPDYAEIYAEYEKHGIEQTLGPVFAPLSGEDLFVSETLLREYAEGVESFFGEIAGYFGAHEHAFF